jgi:hypothetical protein
MSIRLNTRAARGSLLATIAVLSVLLLGTSLLVSDRFAAPLSLVGFVGLIVSRFIARDSRLLPRRIPPLR